jgi:sterol desaturase/sphingolipid hydroxylase (fatty acid hydroxylase superfamily)
MVGRAMDLARLTLGFAVVAGLFMWIERRSSSATLPRRSGRTFATDLLYWVFTPLVTRTITRLSLLLVVLIAAAHSGVTLSAETGVGPLVQGSWITAQPLWVQVALGAVVSDLVGYWIHRAFHRGRLWRFHAIHHSPRALDWLATARVHPVNDVLARVLNVSIVLLLGFDLAAAAVLVPFFGLYGVLLHANVPWDFGPLRGWIASPRFHRWHHAHDEQARGKNFAGLFPWIDRLFGTYFMPAREPTIFGVADDIPLSLRGQLAWPFVENDRSRARD